MELLGLDSRNKTAYRDNLNLLLRSAAKNLVTVATMRFRSHSPLVKPYWIGRYELYLIGDQRGKWSIRPPKMAASIPIGRALA